MAALDFPASSASPWTAPNGVIYTWNTDGYWEAKADPANFDNVFLSKVDDDTAAGAITFEGLTTHEAGVKVTGVEGRSVEPRQVIGAEIIPRLDTSGKLDYFGCQVGPDYNNLSITRDLVSYYAGVPKNVPNGGGGTVSATAFLVQSGFDAAFDGAQVEKVIGFSTNLAERADGKVYNIYSQGTAPNFFNGDIEAENDIRINGFYRNKKPTSALTSTACVSSVADHGNQDVTTSINFVAGKAQNVTGNRLTTVGFQVNSDFNNDYKGGRSAYGFRSNLDADAGGNTYNFYAFGNAPNYFTGVIRCESEYQTAPIDGDGSAPGIGNTFRGVRIQNIGSGIFSINVNNADTADGTAAMYLNRTGTNGQILRLSKNGTERGGIYIDDANITITGQVSDYRIKTNIQPAPSAVDKVKAINVVNFEYTDRAIGETQEGFVAHELAEICPRAVVGAKDATEAIGIFTDADGNVETEVAEPENISFGATWEQTGTRDVYQGVDQTKLIPLLTKALQEALTRIEELESNTLQPLYSTLADLPDASEHHGKTAHVHSEGALYFAHAGSWVKLQNA